MSRDMFSEQQWSCLQEALGTTPREQQVIEHVFDDDHNAAIAEAMGISPSTVHTYMDRLYRRLGVNSRVALVTRVFQVFLDLPCEQDGTSSGRG